MAEETTTELTAAVQAAPEVEALREIRDQADAVLGGGPYEREAPEPQLEDYQAAFDRARDRVEQDSPAPAVQESDGEWSERELVLLDGTKRAEDQAGKLEDAVKTAHELMVPTLADPTIGAAALVHVIRRASDVLRKAIESPPAPVGDQEPEGEPPPIEPGQPVLDAESERERDKAISEFLEAFEEARRRQTEPGQPSLNLEGLARLDAEIDEPALQEGRGDDYQAGRLTGWLEAREWLVSPAPTEEGQGDE
jgi:hypothetical protein